MLELDGSDQSKDPAASTAGKNRRLCVCRGGGRGSLDVLKRRQSPATAGNRTVFPKRIMHCTYVVHNL